MVSVFLLAASLFTGCGNPMNKMDKSTVYLKKDNTVASVSIESFDKEYYKEEELKSFIEEEVTNQQKERGEDSISIEKLTVKEQKATLAMQYQSVEDYVEFNDTELETGVYNKDMMEEELVWIDASSKETVAGEVEEAEGFYYVKIKEPEEMQVLVDGEVLYYLDTMELLDKNLVSVPAGTEGIFLYKK